MKVNTSKPNIEGSLDIFDLETHQDEPLDNDHTTKVHIVNLCASQQYWWKCIEGEECDT